MDTHEIIIKQLSQQKILPLFYHDDTDVCIQVVKALYAAGIRSIEFTNRGEKALNNFKAIVTERNSTMKDLLLAAGTIRTAEKANRFIEAGADFLISPVFDDDICDAAYINKKLWIPGCMTLTEIHIAENNGCRLIKLFPANILGPAFISGIKELFPSVAFLPTGGITTNKEELQQWFSAGAAGVGIGSQLISKKLLAAEDYTAIESSTQDVLTFASTLK